ncbi:MAG TPA: hypothetical protein VHQ42_06645 [Candidatus Limnocylindria bacterium]|nr:hypothetical protein [Candidatus Limnocylindria bacterium]
MITSTGRRLAAAPACVALLLAACASAATPTGEGDSSAPTGSATPPTSASAPASEAAEATPAGSFTLPQEPAAEAIVVDGEALPLLEDPASDPAVGERLPGLSGTSTRGDPMEIGPGDGPMAILVVAHWCPHCQSEVALLSDHLRVNGMPEDIRVVAISTAVDETRGNYPPAQWLADAEWPVETLIDDADGTALRTLGIGAFPALVLVDGDGNVTLRVTGGLNGPTFDQGLDTLRGG